MALMAAQEVAEAQQLLQAALHKAQKTTQQPSAACRSCSTSATSCATINAIPTALSEGHQLTICTQDKAQYAHIQTHKMQTQNKAQCVHTTTDKMQTQ